MQKETLMKNYAQSNQNTKASKQNKQREQLKQRASYIIMVLRKAVQDITVLPTEPEMKTTYFLQCNDLNRVRGWKNCLYVLFLHHRLSVLNLDSH